MVDTIGSAAVQIQVDLDQLDKGLASARTKLEAFDRSAGGQRQLTGLTTASKDAQAALKLLQDQMLRVESTSNTSSNNFVSNNAAVAATLKKLASLDKELVAAEDDLNTARRTSVSAINAQNIALGQASVASDNYVASSNLTVTAVKESGHAFLQTAANIAKISGPLLFGAGVLQQYSPKFKAFTDSIGPAMTKGLEATSDALKDFGTSTSNVGNSVATLSPHTVTLGGTISKMSATFTKTGEVIGKLPEKFEAVSKVVAPLMKVMGGAEMAMAGVHLAQWGPAAVGAAAAVGTLFPAARAQVVHELSDGVKNLVPAFKAITPAAKAAGEATAGMSKSFLAGLLGYAAMFAKPLAIAAAVGTAANELFKAAQEKTDELAANFDKIAKTGLSINFFNRSMKGAEEFKVAADDIYKSMLNFKELATSEFMGGSGGLGKLLEKFSDTEAKMVLESATTLEEKFRAIPKFLQETLVTGDRIAALDLATKIFGKDTAQKLALDHTLLVRMQQTADEISKTKLIDPADAIRAKDLTERFAAAQKYLAEPLFNWTKFDLFMENMKVLAYESTVQLIKNTYTEIELMGKLATTVGTWLAGFGKSEFWKWISGAVSPPKDPMASANVPGTPKSNAGGASLGDQAGLADLIKLNEAFLNAAAASKKYEDALEELMKMSPEDFAEELKLPKLKRAWELATTAVDEYIKKQAGLGKPIDEKVLSGITEKLDTVNTKLNTDSKDAWDKEVLRIGRSTVALQANAAAADKSDSFHESLRVEMLLLNAASKGNTEITEDQIAAYALIRGKIDDVGEALKAVKIKLAPDREDLMTRLSDNAGKARASLTLINFELATTKALAADAISLRGLTAKSPTAKADIAADQKRLELQDTLRKLQEKVNEGKAEEAELTKAQEEAEKQIASTRGLTLASELQGLSDTAKQRDLAMQHQLQNSNLEVAIAGKDLSYQEQARLALQQRQAAEQEALAHGLAGLGQITAAQQKYLDTLKETNKQIGDNKIKAAYNTVVDQTNFATKTMFFSPQDLAVAQALQQIWGPNWENYTNTNLAGAIRYNAQLSEMKDMLSSSASGFIKDLVKGNSLMDSLRSLAGKLGDQLLDSGVKSMINSLMKGLGQDSLGFATGATTAVGILTPGITAAFVAGANAGVSTLSARSLVSGGSGMNAMAQGQLGMNSSIVKDTFKTFNQDVKSSGQDWIKLSGAGSYAVKQDLDTGGETLSYSSDEAGDRIYTSADAGSTRIEDATGGLASAIPKLGSALSSLFGGGGSAVSSVGSAAGGAASGLGGVMSAAGPIAAVAGVALSLWSSYSAKKKAEEEAQAKAWKAWQDAAVDVQIYFNNAAGTVAGALAKGLTEMKTTMEGLLEKRTAVLGNNGAGDPEVKAIVAAMVSYQDRVTLEFRKSFDTALSNFSNGFGSDSPFGRAKSEMASLGEELQAFVSDVNTAFGAATSSGGISGGADTYIMNAALAQVQQAREVAIQYALDQLGVAKTMSTAMEALQKLNGEAQEMQDVLVDLGMSAGAAAEAIADRLTIAVDALRASTEESLKRQIADAQGTSYIYDVLDAITAAAVAANDLFELGGDESLANSLLSVSVQKIIDDNQLMGASYDALIALYPQLTTLTHSYAESLASAARSVSTLARAAEALDDRMLAASIDTSTLAGALASFERTALREREEEIRNGGQLIAQLTAVQELERFNVIKSFADAAAETQRQALETAQDFLDSFARSIREFVDGLRAGANSPLSPQARLAAAQSQYTTQLGLAQGGDQDALSGITGYAQDLLDASKDFYASSSSYQAMFEAVTTQLEALPDQLSATDLIVGAVDDAASAIVTATQAMQAVLVAVLTTGNLMSIASSLLSYLPQIDLNTDSGITKLEMQAALGTNYTSGMQAAIDRVFTELDGNGNGVLEKAELIKAATVNTSTNTAGTQNAVNVKGDATVGSVNLGTSVEESMEDLLNTIKNQLVVAGNINVSYSDGLNGGSTVLNMQNNMLTALNKIVVNTWAISANTSIANTQRVIANPGAFLPVAGYAGTFAMGGVIPPGGIGLVSEHSSGGGRLLRAPMNESITVSPFNPSGGGSPSIIAALQSLGRLLVRAEVASAEHVGNKIDGVSEAIDETGREAQFLAA